MIDAEVATAGSKILFTDNSVKLILPPLVLNSVDAL